jgi:hypothetical protein
MQNIWAGRAFIVSNRRATDALISGHGSSFASISRVSNA